MAKWIYLTGTAVLAISSPDTASGAMAGADTLNLGFAVPALAEGQVREFFLAVDATLLASRAAQLGRSGLSTPAVPTAFALRQNHPNPFSIATTIRFELPVGAIVRMDVFDAQGRRARTLANRYFTAGYQSLIWDHRNGEGGVLGPGVYFYRIEAGPFRDRKKMVLVP